VDHGGFLLRYNGRAAGGCHLRPPRAGREGELSTGDSSNFLMKPRGSSVQMGGIAITALS